MYPNQASYIAVHPGFIRMTKKLSYSQTEKLRSPDLKWDSFFILTPMRFIQLPGDFPQLYISISSFLYRGSSWFDKNNEEVASYVAVHPGLIRITKKFSYSQTGKLGSPDLKVG
ncbi:hypothetical protein Bca101_101115 [Brassica carinata]